MSTQTEITRLQTARNKIRTWLVGLGLATSTDKLDALATTIAAIKNQGAVDAQVKEGESYTIPKGYHNGGGSVKGVGGGGNYTLQAKTVTPSKQQQSVSSDDGYYGLSSVTVLPIPSNYNDTSNVTASAADVLSPKIIVGADGAEVAGTMANNGTLSATIDGLTQTSYTLSAGYYAGGTVSLTSDIETALAAI